MEASVKESCARKPRFNFEGGGGVGTDLTATIKELLEELLYESSTTTAGQLIDTEARQMSIAQLNPVLRILRSVSGKPLKSAVEDHPIDDIRTIKTLYNYSYDSGMHLIRMLEPPGPNSEAIVGVLTSPPTKENEGVIEARRRILNDLEKAVCVEEKELIDALFNPWNAPHLHWRETNDAIDKILLTHFHIESDRDLLGECDRYLIAKTDEFMSKIAPLRREQRLHTAAYVHLRALEFLHSLQFQITTNRTIRNDKTIGNVQMDFSRICDSLPPVQGVVIQGHNPFMSLDEVLAFSTENAGEIARLVSRATGFVYNRRDILKGKDAIRARYALEVYLASINLPSNDNPKPIAVVHVVAAFCSVLHQRKLKSKPMKSRRYGSKISSPQKQLDAFIEGKVTHLASTAWFIYSERTLWYTQAMLGRLGMASSHKPLQTAQARFLKEAYASLDHVQIRALIDSYRSCMVKAAEEFVVLHGKHGTQYDWVHGLRRE